jgi:hypothetical protein
MTTHPSEGGNALVSGRLIHPAWQAFSRVSESRAGLPLVFFFSVVLIGTLFIVRWESDLNFDGEVFLSAAQKFEQGRFREGLSIYPLPLYPGLIALLYPLISDWVIAGRLICYVFMTLTVVPLYLLTRDIFDPQGAFFACIVFALLPETQLMSVSVLRDPGFFHFLMWAMVFGNKALQSRKTKHLLGAALLAFAAMLFRLEGAIIYPLYLGLLLVLVWSPGGGRREYARLFRAWAILLACLAITYLSVFGLQNGLAEKYSVFANQSGDLLSFQNYHRIAEQLQQIKDAAPRSDIGKHFGDLATQLIIPIYLFGTFQVFFSVIQAVNVPALVVGLSRFRLTASQAFLALSGATSLALMFGYFVWHDFVLQRYMFLAALLFCPWIGLGVTRILGFLSKMPKGQLFCAGFILFLALGSVAGFGKYFWKMEDLKSKAGSWVADQAEFAECKILFNDPVVAFYSGRDISFGGDGEILVYRDVDDRRFSKIESAALQAHADLIVVYLKAERQTSLHQLQHYFMLKEIEGRDRKVLIYGLRERFPAPKN